MSSVQCGESVVFHAVAAAVLPLTHQPSCSDTPWLSPFLRARMVEALKAARTDHTRAASYSSLFAAILLADIAIVNKQMQVYTLLRSRLLRNMTKLRGVTQNLAEEDKTGLMLAWWLSWDDGICAMCRHNRVVACISGLERSLSWKHYKHQDGGYMGGCTKKNGCISMAVAGRSDCTCMMHI